MRETAKELTNGKWWSGDAGGCEAGRRDGGRIDRKVRGSRRRRREGKLKV